MRRPVQALEIAGDPKVLLAIMMGVKKISIREDHRDYVPGKLIIYSADCNFVTETKVTDVRHTTLMEITPEEMTADGYQSLEEMYEDLRSHYPKLKRNSPVTVIRWSGLSEHWDEINIKDFAKDHNLLDLFNRYKDGKR